MTAADAAAEDPHCPHADRSAKRGYSPFAVKMAAADLSVSHRIIPAATVSLVASSMRMNAPVSLLSA